MKRVAVIGAGMAGLSCAYSLRRRGMESTVFEALPVAGGRSRTARIEGYTIDAGAQYLLGRDVFSNTFRLLGELGMSDDILPVSPTVGQVYKGSISRHRVHSAASLLKFKGLNLADKAFLSRMVYLLLRFGPALDLHHPERGLALDDESVASFVKRELSQNILNYVAGPLISTLFFYGSEETSKLLYLLLAKYMHDTRLYTIRGGIGRLASRVAEELDIETNTPVRRIDTDGTAYVLAGRRFSNIVIAAQGDAVLDIGGIRELLSDADRRFLEQCRYQRAVTVFVGSDRPMDGQCYGLSIPRVEKFSAAAVAFHDFIDRSRVPKGRGLLAVTGGGNDVSLETLIRDLQMLYSEKPVFTREYTWNSGMPKFPPGRFREIDAFMRRARRPGLHFCGDYLMGPSIEAAITTGLNAASRIADREQ